MLWENYFWFIYIVYVVKIIHSETKDFEFYTLSVLILNVCITTPVIR